MAAALLQDQRLTVGDQVISLVGERIGVVTSASDDHFVLWRDGASWRIDTACVDRREDGIVSLICADFGLARYILGRAEAPALVAS
jgi:hypothetical protein